MVLIMMSEGLIYVIKTAQCLVNEKIMAAHIHIVQYSQNCAWSGKGAVTSHFSSKTTQCLVSKKTVAAQIHVVQY